MPPPPLSEGDFDNFALRLIVGHELVADDSPLARLFAIPAADARQVETFRSAERALGSGETVDVRSCDHVLRQIPINTAQSGNSYADLLLSCVGWHFGRRIRNAIITTPAAAGQFVRRNLVDRPGVPVPDIPAAQPNVASA